MSTIPVIAPRMALINFFSAVLPPQEKDQVFVAATPYPKKNSDDKPLMKHIYANTHAELADRVLQINNDGKEAYYALGRFTPHKTTSGNPGRKGEYVQALKAFWVDIDVGKDKSADSLGYPTQEEAVTAIRDFVKQYGLPLPTHVIVSGGGIHAYWTLDRVVTPEEWKPISIKLKELADKHGFLADPARTADVASILRPPFTQNHKLDTPRDVKIKRSKSPIKFSEFTDAINTAHVQHCGANTSCPASGIFSALPSNLAQKSNLKSPPLETPEEIERVKAMLAVIPANCDRKTWLNIIWAVADTGWACADKLARAWSKTAPEKYDESSFNNDWNSFDPNKQDRITLSTLVHYANQHGWTDTKNNDEQLPEWLKTINQNYAWIEEYASIYRLEYADFIDPNKFKVQFGNQLVPVKSGDTTKSIGAGTAWLTHGKRRQHKKLVFSPNEGLVTQDNCLNEWQGFDVTQHHGNVAPFSELLERLVPDNEAREYVLSWMAHLLQHPEIKMNVSLAFWSHAQGVGKNLLFECLSSIIGKTHAANIGQTQLASNFNGWAHRKVLVIGDEVSSTNSRQDSDKLKGLVTGTTFHINEKYQPEREAQNFLNFIFLSNHHDALFVNDHDRRFFVWEVTAGKLPEAMAQAFVQWRDNGGLQALLHYLINYNIAISNFNPKAPAPMTEAKLQMVNDNRSDLEVWLHDLIDSGASKILGREIATAHEIAQKYYHDTGDKQPTTKAVTGACKRLGAYARPCQVRLNNGKKVRALALDRPKYWEQQPEAAWSVEMQKPLRDSSGLPRIMPHVQDTPQMRLASCLR